MTSEARQDAFERRYMAAFDALAADYGIRVKYDRDRAARDVGLHFLRKSRSGSELITGSLVWFQMKGVMKDTLSSADFRRGTHVPLRLRVQDLQLWYRMNSPTYLAVYVESEDLFLVLDLVEYIERAYGKSVFQLRAKTVTVRVPKANVLDEQAFRLMMRKGDLAEWGRLFEAEPGELQLCHRDFSVIWRIGSAPIRDVELRVDVVDWQSKLRGEVNFSERSTLDADAEWRTVRRHFQFGLSVHDVEAVYPYLDFTAFDEDRQGEIEFWDNDDGEPAVQLASGEIIYGVEAAGEYNAFEFRPCLNEVGRRLVGIVTTLVDAGLLEFPDEDDADLIDVAPWHSRGV